MFMTRGSSAPSASGEAFVIGCDLGQRVDFCAIAVDQVTGYGGETRHAIRHLERFRSVDFPTIVERLRSVLASLGQGSKTLALDATGIGGPFLDFVRAAHLPGSLVGITITSGSEARTERDQVWLPKPQLVGALALSLSTRRVTISATMRNSEALRRELEAFSVTMTAGGHQTMEAAGGGHDDTVLALALCVWTAEKKRAGPFLFASAGAAGGPEGGWHSGGW
jgi:hypothetical protein